LYVHSIFISFRFAFSLDICATATAKDMHGEHDCAALYSNTIHPHISTP